MLQHFEMKFPEVQNVKRSLRQMLCGIRSINGIFGTKRPSRNEKQGKA